MTQITTKEEYRRIFQKKLARSGSDRANLRPYLENQLQQMNQLTVSISNETFWQVFPKILGIDAKLNLLVELIQFDDFSNNEIVRVIEKDYKNYFKELCGYDLKMKTKPSIIFQVH